MGQAFDSRGNVLGSAYGETKRDVFDKLTEAHPDAAEIRIRSLAPEETDPPQTEMPRYRCHKEVWALKIAAVTHNGSALITPADDGYAEFRVDADYVRKHNPQIGGYYVVYKDGYTSFSPAAAFEEGYMRI